MAGDGGEVGREGRADLVEQGAGEGVGAELRGEDLEQALHLAQRAGVRLPLRSQQGALVRREPGKFAHGIPASV